MAWQEFALCRDMPSEIFFPQDDDANPEEAKRICYQCPVRRPCLVEAMLKPEYYGIWGGLSARERRRLRQRKRVIVLKEAS